MGVTGLWKLIDQSGKPVPVDTLENKVLAVDISIWLHQVVKGFQDSNGATLPNAHLLGLFHRLCKLLYYRIRPVFVFDGGVPPLKRETIAKRARNKNKYQNEADKLQQLLLEALAKEKVVQQALGPSTSALVSPRKSVQKVNENDDNDMFKLPPIQEDLVKDDSITDISESDSSFDDKQRVYYSSNLQAIDVKSSHFQSLPADIRHEILSDIKEMRKQSSWGRLHELPAESQSFSSFQMKRLLKRRQVQVELEEAEKEMGGKGLSMAELENLLSEEGVVDPDIATERVASNEHIRFLHVRDITKAMKKEADEKVKQEQLNVIEEEPDENEVTPMVKSEDMTDEDFDLQRAIQMSLGGEDPLGDANTTSECDTVRLTVEQRKALGSAANSLARHYMVEYGGMNDEEVSDLVKIDESLNATQEFKFNDDSILIGKIDRNAPSTSTFQAKEISQMLSVEKEKVIDISESSDDEANVSSGADSDFIDVPEIDFEVDQAFLARAKRPLPPPFLMNEIPFDSKSVEETTGSKIEVTINPADICEIEDDDIFADIFTETETKSDVKSKEEKCKIVMETVIKIDDSPQKAVQNDERSKEPKEKSFESAETKMVSNSDKNSSDSKMQSILNELNVKKSTVTQLSLDDLLGTKSNRSETAGTSKETSFLDKLKQDKIEDASNEMTTPTKIPQPFFVKKTPPSSKKKSPASAKNDDISSASPSKAVKSLADAFECLPSPSSQSVAEKDSVEMAAGVLREKKSKEELEDIAEQLNQERRDLVAERNKKDRLGVSITEQMSMECMDLLRLFGVPYIVAPMEAEAQCAYLNEIELTEGTITDDSDIWLFGGKTVYKNFFDQNKHVLEYKSENIHRLFHLDRHKLIQLSFLVGSDYTQGIHGVGAVTALEVLSFFPATPEKEGETTNVVSIISSLRKFRDWWQNKAHGYKANALRKKLKNIKLTEDFPNIRVVEAYLYPTVDENREKFTWGHPELESLREYAKKTFGWTKSRTDDIILPVMKRLSEKRSQQSIQNYFKITGITSRTDLKVSKRVRTALNQMDPEAPIVIDDDNDDGVGVVPEKKPKKKPTKKTAAKNDKDTTNKSKGKPGRKRKMATDTIAEQQHINSDAKPSTSAVNGTKKIILPDNNEPIPQREKDKEIMESNRLKAIEVLKKMKTKIKKK
ncbi:DNA repair protein complementing XP-G cells homolog [Contarinia nasturtii]|uniref:DNA repair protein complementing XP-G cells homolog n=1 Tax=Contarinia nasturtii TaxID=265458 RepID=UPI0012D391C0|nr:DNA repair protein complementing XP-G cells homolog [Contarinia nasturtii]